MTASSGEEGEVVDPATALVTGGGVEESARRSEFLAKMAEGLPTQD